MNIHTPSTPHSSSVLPSLSTPNPYFRSNNTPIYIPRLSFRALSQSPSFGTPLIAFHSSFTQPYLDAYSLTSIRFTGEEIPIQTSEMQRTQHTKRIIGCLYTRTSTSGYSGTMCPIHPASLGMRHHALIIRTSNIIRACSNMC